jgi:hypothetical protein
VYDNKDLNDWQKEQYIASLGKLPTICHQECESELSSFLDTTYPNLTYIILSFKYLVEQLEVYATS